MKKRLGAGEKIPALDDVSPTFAPFVAAIARGGVHAVVPPKMIDGGKNSSPHPYPRMSPSRHHARVTFYMSLSV